MSCSHGLRHLIAEGDLSGYGLVNAVTHYSQEVEDYDRATEFEALPWLLVFIAAATVDGSLVRLVKSKELLHHDPEMFALYVSMAILISCATVLAFVWPISLHPLIVPCVPLAVGALLALAIQHFHRRT